jgi:hypothetical protein
MDERLTLVRPRDKRRARREARRNQTAALQYAQLIALVQAVPVPFVTAAMAARFLERLKAVA